MEREKIKRTKLTILTQGSPLKEGECKNGVFSLTKEGYRFEESVRKMRNPKNPKLFDGHVISMYRQSNGNYRLFLKMFDPKVMNKDFLLNQVYAELQEALNITE